jgi:hypothetical protein
VVGTYRFTQLDGDALAEARAAIGDAAPSEQVLLQARWRPLDARGDGGPIETERPIFRDCPQLLGFGPNLDLHPLGDGTWVLEDAIAIDLPIDATRDALIGAAMDAARAGVAILAGTVIIEPVAVRVETEDGGIVYPALVIEIVSCEETDWFRCGEPAAAVERR